MRENKCDRFDSCSHALSFEAALRLQGIRKIGPNMLSRKRPYQTVKLINAGSKDRPACVQVLLGEYKVKVYVRYKPHNHVQPETIISNGSFGRVSAKYINGVQYVTKIIKFDITYHLKDAIIEVAIGKLCGGFGIGPEVIRSRQDIILYRDAAEFDMERCQHISDRLVGATTADLSQCKQDIDQCVGVLHGLGIAHRDIKPANMLWSIRRKKFLLCDFGISVFVREERGKLSMTNYAGTNQFMGYAMQQLKRAIPQRGRVDLYDNDRQSVDKTMQSIAESHLPSKKGIKSKHLDYFEAIQKAIQSNQQGQQQEAGVTGVVNIEQHIYMGECLSEQLPPISAQFAHCLNPSVRKGLPEYDMQMFQRIVGGSTRVELSQDQRSRLQAIGNAIFLKKNRKSIRLWKQIARRSKNTLPAALLSACFGVVLGFYSNQTKERLMSRLLSIVTSPQKLRKSRFFGSLLKLIGVHKASAQSEMFTIEELRSYVNKERSIEKCMLLTNYYYLLRQQNSAGMLQICTTLERKIAEQPIEQYYLELINIWNLSFIVRLYMHQVSYRMALQHYTACSKLLSQHHPEQNALQLIQLYGDELCCLQMFEFPSEEIQAIRDRVDRSYALFDLPTSNVYGLVRKAIHENCELPKQTPFNALTLRNILTKQRNASAKSRLDSRIILSHCLLMNGRQVEADQLLQTVKQQAERSISPRIGLNYYNVRYQIDEQLSDSESGFEQFRTNLLQAMKFNDRLQPCQAQQRAAYQLREALAHLEGHLRRFQSSLCMLRQLERELLSNKDFYLRELVFNYSAQADVLRAINRFQQSSRYCQRIFELEKKRLISRSESIIAHRIAIRNTSAMGKQQNMLNHCWAVIDVSRTIGDEDFLMAFTPILHYYRSTVGDELFSIIRYVCQFANKPSQQYRSIEIDEEFYSSPIRSGVLPYEISTEQFIRTAESRIESLQKWRQLACYRYKQRLLKMMRNQFQHKPAFKLVYMRTLLEMQLHLLQLSKPTTTEMQGLINSIKEIAVDEADRICKRQLIAFAKDIFVRESSKSKGSAKRR